MLVPNDIFEFRPDAARYRLLAVQVNEDVAWVIRLGDDRALPENKWSNTRLQSLYKAGDAVRVVADGIAAPRRGTEKAKQRAKKAMERIKPLVDSPDIFDASSRWELLEARAAALSCSTKTLYKDLRRYWSGGQTSDALLGRFHLSGKPRPALDGSGNLDPATPVTAGRGRKPKHGDYQSFQMTKQDIDAIVKGIRTHFLGNLKSSAAAAFQKILEDESLPYSYLDGEGHRVIRPAGECPSDHQFYHILYTRFTREEVLRKRKGATEFDRDFAPKTGSAQADCLGVGHIGEIDATIADIWVVHEKDRSRIVGKPTVFRIYDKRSRLLIGFYCGLEPPSWSSAMLAILSIAEGGAVLCKRYGIKYNPDDWPAEGLYPQEFVGDRGEMLSRNSSKMVNGLERTVTNLPVGRGDSKGTVECGFRLMHATIADSVAGYEPPTNPFKRRGKKYYKDACHTTTEIGGILLRAAILESRTPMDNYPLPLEMLSRGVPATPAAIWLDEAPRRVGALTRFPVDFVRFSLLPQGTATVDSDGIWFEGCAYTCDEAMRDGWFVRANRGVFKVAISYDPRLVDFVYIHDVNDATRFITAPLLPKSDEYRGLSFLEVKNYEKLRGKARFQGRQTKRQLKSDFHADIAEVSANARAEMVKATAGKTRKSRRVDTKADRVDARRAHRQQDARMSQPEKPTLQPCGVVVPLTQPEATAVRTVDDSAAMETPPLSLKEKLARKRKEIQDGN